MAKSSARKTADAIHSIPEYYTGTIEPTGDQLKMGDVWFEDLVRMAKSSGKPLASISRIVEKRKKEAAGRPPVKIPKLKRKRSR